MAFSFNTAVGNGAPQILAVPEYLAKSHIKVSLDGVETTNFEWVTASSIRLTAGVGQTIKVIRRTSPSERLVDYLDGSQLTEEVLDVDSLQAFYLSQEAYDAGQRQNLTDEPSGSLRAPFPETPSAIPKATQRANKLLGFDDSGNPIAVAPVAQTANALALQLASSAGTNGVGTVQDKVTAVPRTQRSKNSDVWSISDFGTTSGGDDTTILQRAFASGEHIVVPRIGRQYRYSEPLVIPYPATVTFEGFLTALTNGVPDGTPTIKVMSDDVYLRGAGGGINNQSADLKNWAGVYAQKSSLERLSNVRVEDMVFRNLAIDSTAAFAVNFDGVDDGTMLRNLLQRVGVIGNVLGGGYGLYMQFCSGCNVDQNKLRYVGSTGINDSAGLGNLINGNIASFTTLFAHKGGYAQNITTITNHITPTAYSFSVARTDSARRNLLPGLAVLLFNPSGEFPIAVISKVVDTGSYLQVFLQNAALDVLPQVGAQVQALITNTSWSANRVNYTGDNAWDINGWHGISASGNTINGAGMYADAGTYAGLGCGMWFGYDEQDNENRMRAGKLSACDNTFDSIGGSAIAVMSTAIEIVTDMNRIGEVNRRGFTGNDGLPTAGAIEHHRLAFMRSARASACNNMIKSKQGFGIMSSYGSGNMVNDNSIEVSDLALIINSQKDTEAKGNRIRTTFNFGGIAAVLIRDASGVNHNDDVRLAGNDIEVASGYPIKNIDPGYDATVGNFNGNTCAGGQDGVGLWDIGGTLLYESSINGATYWESKNKQVLNGNRLLLSSTLAATGAFKVNVISQQYPNVSLAGEYIVRRTGPTLEVITVRACADVTVTIDGAYFTSVNNVSGGTRTLYATLEKHQ